MYDKEGNHIEPPIPVTTNQPICSTTQGNFGYTSGCDHWYRFLDFLGVKKDEGTFYCQKCLEIRIKKATILADKV